MDVSTIIELSRKQTGTTAWQISDNDYLKYVNIVYKDIFSSLFTDSKKYTWQTYKTDIVANQSEYILPNPTSDTDNGGLKVLLNVFYDKKRIPVYDTSLYTDFKELTDKNDKPYSIMRDGSIFIIPIPDKNITGWLVIEWKYIPIDLTLATTSDEIKLPPEDHNIIVKWLNSMVFWEKQVYDKQQLWEWYYQQAVKQMQIDGCFDNESWYHAEDAYLWFLE